MTTYQTEPKVLGKPGLWKGKFFTVERLQRIAAQATELMKHGMYPGILLGHDKDQDVARELGFEFSSVSGLPDIGRACKVWWDDAKQVLLGQFDGLPKKLADLIDAGQYKDVSMELEHKWHNDTNGETWDDVMPFVAFLGLEWAGIKGMGDHLAMAKENYSATHIRRLGDREITTESIRLSDIEPVAGDANPEGGDEGMADLEGRIRELEGKLAKLDTLAADFAAAKDSIEALTTERDELTEKLATTETERDDAKKLVELAAKADEAAAVKIKDAEIADTLTEAVSDKKMSPAEAKKRTPALLAMDYKTPTIKFADKDGNEETLSVLHAELRAITERPAGHADHFSEHSVKSDDNVHGGTEGEESDIDKFVRGKMGMERAEDGSWVEPKADDEK